MLDRRHFVGSFAGVTALLAAGCTRATHTAAGAPAPRPSPGRWDDAWTTRLGAHRVVFDVAELDAAPGAGQIEPVMDSYHDVLGTRDADLGFVLVVRHRAIPMAFQDAVWERYDVAADFKRDDPTTKAPFRRNPFAPMLATLRQRGVTILACNSAAVGAGAIYAQRAKADVATVRAEVLGALLPGVILLPNGLYALARAQDVGCGFMR